MHPYFASGATFAVVGKVPIGERFELFGKVGDFVWDNSEARLNVTSPPGQSGLSVVDHDGSDLFYGVGVPLELGHGWHVRAEWERYAIDDQDVDFLSFGVERRIPRKH